MKKWFFNPFTYIAGTKALVIGWLIIIVTAIVAYFSHAHFDGVIDLHFGAPAPAIAYLLEPFVDWFCLVICLYIIARIVSDTSIRLIDFAGTIALARCPGFLMVFLGFISTPAVDPKAPLEDLEKTVLSTSIIQGLLTLPLVIWLIALFYNAFSVSANIKGQKAAWTFIIGLAVAEVLSKVIFMQIQI